jgi:glycosyltransferase involved in cell wall biosynthesis
MLPVLLHFNFILIMIKYSIIVCSYNRYNFLIETIESVLTVLKNRSDFELLVIDNNSPDETSSIKEKYV